MALLLGEQPEYGKCALTADVNFTICDSRDRELHRATGGTCATARAAKEQGCDVGGIVSIQNGAAAGSPGGEIKNPDDSIGCATRRDGWDRPPGRVRIARNGELRSRYRAVRNCELAQRKALPGGVDVSFPVGGHAIVAAVDLGGIWRWHRDHFLHIVV